MKTYTNQLTASLTLTALLLSGATVFADHHESDKSNVTGVWKWTMQSRNNESREVTMTLIQHGDDLLGSVSGRESDREIENGKVTDDKISFVSTRESQRGKMEIHYSGSVKGDVLDGQLKASFGDRTFEREFQAKRQPVKATGNWDFVLTRSNGEELNATLTLKEAAGKLNGSFSSDNFDLDLNKVSLSGAVLQFQTTFEGGGESMTIKHQAAVLGDKIKGHATGERNGETFTRQWTATRK